mmetsp:Transcript_74690/g.199236  ORF Transcript_74690/g.199236 Transcript_74690/m.199236 type:complete len:433 (+) Transcript_74690:29-1327(+)
MPADGVPFTVLQCLSRDADVIRRRLETESGRLRRSQGWKAQSWAIKDPTRYKAAWLAVMLCAVVVEAIGREHCTTAAGAGHCSLAISSDAHNLVAPLLGFFISANAVWASVRWTKAQAAWAKLQGKLTAFANFGFRTTDPSTRQTCASLLFCFAVFCGCRVCGVSLTPDWLPKHRLSAAELEGLLESPNRRTACIRRVGELLASDDDGDAVARELLALEALAVDCELAGQGALPSHLRLYVTVVLALFLCTYPCVLVGNRVLEGVESAAAQNLVVVGCVASAYLALHSVADQLQYPYGEGCHQVPVAKLLLQLHLDLLEAPEIAPGPGKLRDTSGPDVVKDARASFEKAELTNHVRTLVGIVDEHSRRQQSQARQAERLLRCHEHLLEQIQVARPARPDPLSYHSSLAPLSAPVPRPRDSEREYSGWCQTTS